jgi:hypothetical protein
LRKTLVSAVAAQQRPKTLSLARVLHQHT